MHTTTPRQQIRLDIHDSYLELIDAARVFKVNSLQEAVTVLDDMLVDRHIGIEYAESRKAVTLRLILDGRDIELQFTQNWIIDYSYINALVETLKVLNVLVRRTVVINDMTLT